MIIATGAVECIAFRARILDGNHDNMPLIDRQVLYALERLWGGELAFSNSVRAICAEIKATLTAERASDAQRART